MDQRWIDTSTGTATDEFQYGYDRDSNRLYRENAVDAVFSELYQYDNLNQLTSFERGQLNSTKDGITGTPSRSQDWSFDALGNWNSVTTDGTAQTRSHNQQNQITSISSATTPTYDANGNMTGDETGRQFVYDAWNRLVTVKDSGGGTLTSYKYDALSRRISENPGTARELYYSAQWQVIEERESGVAVVQQVWSPVYVDAMILRDRDTDGNGSLDERLWVQQDANWNVTALLDNNGNVVERNIYDPFGVASTLAPDWTSRSSSSYAWVYLFQGTRYDSTSGLDDMRGRVYSPTLGRFGQNDPSGLKAGDANLYRALANVPTGGIDPDGLRTLYERFWGTVDSGYDRPEWPGGNFMRAPDPQPSMEPGLLDRVDQDMMNRIHASNSGVDMPPLVYGNSVPIYGADGNRYMVEAMVQAGQRTRSVMHLAMTPFFFTPIGPLASLCSGADHLANGEYWEAAGDLALPVALHGGASLLGRARNLVRGRRFVRAPITAQGIPAGSMRSWLRGTRVDADLDVLLYTGRQQTRAQGLMEEAARAAGLNLSDYVDDVVAVSRNLGNADVTPFFTVMNGRRTVGLTRAVLRRPRAGQLIDALHELNHARQSRLLGHARYDALVNSSERARAQIEIMVQDNAIRQAQGYLGDIPTTILANERAYIDDWSRVFFEELFSWGTQLP